MGENDLNATLTPARGRRSLGATLLEFLGSMNLAITLLVVIAIASVIGTVLKQNEAYNNYVFKFGDFWFEVFKSLGLFDVYGAGWFLVLLGFLILSTSVCVYRQWPGMMRDINHFRLDVQEKSLRGFHLKAEWSQVGSAESVAKPLSAALSNAGYRIRSKQREDGMMVAGMKGSASRLGYLLSHVGIVVICLGALVDGNLPLKLAEMRGELAIETRDLAVQDIPSESTLGEDNLSFRGSVNVPEGGRANFVFLPVRNGYLLQHLPFTIELERFHVEYYDRGMPKSFVSDVLIHDDELDEPLRRSIEVNHPLIYKGYAIYQANFSDGGTKLNLNAWSFDRPDAEPLKLSGEVHRQLEIVTPSGKRTVEFNDFKLHNIFPTEEGSEKPFQDYGPSIVFKLREPNGQAREYVNYLVPMNLNGRLYRMSGVRESVAEDYRYLYIPLDEDVSVERFMRLRALALDPARIRAVAEAQADGLTQLTDAQRTIVVDSMEVLMKVFIVSGLDEVVARVERTAPESERGAVVESYIQLIQSMMGEIFLELLTNEGVDISQGVSAEDAAFFEDSLEALSLLGAYGSPVFLEVADFEHIEASGLQITRAPGQGIVYFGCVMLMFGVFFMFYLHHRRLWLWLREEGDEVQVLFAGSGHRNRDEFTAEFEKLQGGLRGLADKQRRLDEL